MKNEYDIRGDVTAIIIESPKHGRMETLIATSDLPRAQEFPGNWGVFWSKGTGSFYVCSSLQTVDGKRTTVLLHRWILNITDQKEHVDHVLHDTLDNCRWALNEVTNGENQQNKRKQSNNRSGVTGVVWHNASAKWHARIKVDGHRIHLGTFDSLESATTARKAAEIEYHPYKQKIS